jgi:3alpha(or 20beta)-hydroxysteroid dehydrogenase
MRDLADKVAIVTGAARGTGSVIARRLVEHGTRVLLGDILEDAGRATADSLGERAIFVSHDVTSPEGWSEMVAMAVEAYGHLDILVNNAAVLHLGTIENTPADTLQRLLEVNTVGPYLGMRAVLDPMRRRGGGSIVNIGSLDGLIGMNGVSAYCTSKWALRGMAKSASMELGRDGIRVNTVCPAGGNVEMYGPWMQQLAANIEQTRAYTENRGIPGEAPLEAIADAVLFLASDASRHCTGIDLPVDGGASAGCFLPVFNTL